MIGRRLSADALARRLERASELDLPANTTHDGAPLGGDAPLALGTLDATGERVIGTMRPAQAIGLTVVYGWGAAYTLTIAGSSGSFSPSPDADGAIGLETTATANFGTQYLALYQSSLLGLGPQGNGDRLEVRIRARVRRCDYSLATNRVVIGLTGDTTPVTGVLDTAIASVASQLLAFWHDGAIDDKLYFAANDAAGDHSLTDTGLTWSDVDNEDTTFVIGLGTTATAWRVEQAGVVIASGSHTTNLPTSAQLGPLVGNRSTATGTATLTVRFYGIDIVSLGAA